MQGKEVKMKACDVKPGDVVKIDSTNCIVRDVVIMARGVKLLLAEGRTDPGNWYGYPNPQSELDVFRMPEARHD